MACEFKTQRRVAFADTDCAGIAHFAVFLQYMEDAEHDFLRSLGLSVRKPYNDGAAGFVVGFPRMAVHFEYSRPVTFEDLLDVHLWISQKRNRTIEYSCVVTHEGKAVGHGQMVVIACRVREGHAIKPIPLPEEFDRALEVAPYPPLEFRSGKGGVNG